MPATYDERLSNPTASRARIQVLIADERPVVRAGLAHMLSTADELQVLGAAGQGEEILAMAEAHRPDLVLVNLDMPDGAGIAATRAVLGRVPGTRVIGLALSNDERALDGLAAGAVGCLFRDSDVDELVGSIVAAVWGGPSLTRQTARHLWGPRAARGPAERLTPRQQDILALVGLGLPNKTIARRLKITEKTVKSNLTSIFRQLGVDSRTQAALWALRHGMVE
jgi:DNA-binding NarL/FixJ family response regulator